MDLYRINLNLLIALDMLLLERSVTLAAKKLFITQAAMSNNLQQLREIFKDELLMREKNYMVLTHYAKELQPKLHQVLQEVHSLITSGQSFVPEKSDRTFKIGLNDYMSSLLLPKLFCLLKKKAPNLKIVVTAMDNISTAEPFERGDYDLCVGKAFNPAESIRTHLLYQETISCIVNPNHPLAKKKKITLKDYLSGQHVAMCGNNPLHPPIIEQALARLGLQRNVKVGLPFVNPILSIIEKSDTLIGTVVHRIAERYQKHFNYVIQPLPLDIPEINIYLAWHQRCENDFGHQWLRQQIIELFVR